MKILVVDDDPDIRRLMHAGLKQAAHEVVEAESATEGQALCRAVTFDLVVTDLCLPDGHGLDVIKTLRERHPKAACLVVTGGGPAHDEVIGELAAFDGISVLRKPFRLAELRSAVAAAATPPA